MDLEARIAGAVDEGRWDDALELLRSSGDQPRSPNLLELQARAAYGHGDFEASISAWEEQHRLLRTMGDAPGAARAAAMIAMFLLIDTGLMSPVRAWLRRAEGLLDGHTDSPVDALIAAVNTYERFMCGDIAGARRLADRAVELGRRHGNLAAEVIGRTAGARVTILEGRVEEGLAQLDGVGSVLLSGEVDALTTGMMLCELVCAAQGLALHDMAVQWTDAMDRWGRGAAFGGLHGRCRVHRAELLRVAGPGDAAEDEALGACDELRPWMRREFGWPLAELGTIRLRRGDLRGAEEAFVAAHEHAWCPHPGLALLRLAQGDLDAARALIDDAIAHPFLTPSKERPPAVDLTLAPLLEAQVEIAVAAGDAGTARRAGVALRSIAERYRSPWLGAAASLAEARTALLTGEPESAVTAAGAAVAAWADIGAPYETAVARTVLGQALARSGRPAVAEMEWRAAVAAFDRYGAEDRSARTRDLLHPRPSAGSRPGEANLPGPAAVRPSATFRRDGDTRLVDFAGERAVLRDLKGFRYLERLLAEPNREFHVLDLVAVEQGTLPTGRPEVVGDAELGPGGGSLPLIDEEARQAYRRRLAEVEDDLGDALRCNDPDRAELAERDREYLLAELRRAVGLGGRLRGVGSDAERARTAVARALRYAVARLTGPTPALARHLDNCLHTGTYCSYRPDPVTPVEWSY